MRFAPMSAPPPALDAGVVDDRRGGAQCLGISDQGLSKRDFIRIAANGWGDPLNAYAYSMAWFRGALYVGNSRGNLVMIHRHHPEWMKTWPVPMPKNFHDIDFRAQIWRYLPATSQWERIHSSPLVPGRENKLVPRDLGYRAMTIHREALYAAAFSASSSGLPPPILCSCDGKTFSTVGAAGSDPALNTYRILQVYKGHLYTSPTGRTGGDTNASNAAVVLECGDPKSEPWREVSSLGFGDRNNQTFFEMAEFDDHLYVGTLNPVSGFQIWKTRGGRLPYSWSCVLADGAGRRNLNEIAISMVPFQGALYVGTAIQNGGYDRPNRVGPAAAELIRIHPDGTWDLIVGTPRYTSAGHKFPLSGRGPGFDNPFNGYFWRMAVHEGWLYLGTYKWTVFLPYLSQEQWNAEFREMVDRVGIDDLAGFAGGCDLWRSPDGVNWYPVTRNGFDNPCNHGIRTLQSTPFGLFVGTANPFGPQMASRVRGQGGQGKWEFRDNPLGGLEVWMGAKRTAPRDALQSRAVRSNKRDRPGGSLC